jgi:hypothetical protein
MSEVGDISSHDPLFLVNHGSANLRSQDSIDVEVDRRIAVLIIPLLRQRNSLSDISRLPHELMERIFQDAVLGQGNPSNSTSALMTISHVCYAWKLAALEDGTLWSQVDLAYPRLAETYLQRSGSRPFRVYFHLALYKEFTPSASVALCGAFEQVLNNASRLESIDLRLPSLGDYFERHLIPLMQGRNISFPVLRYINADFTVAEGDTKHARWICLYPNMEHFVEDGAPVISYLNLRGCYFLGDSSIHQLLIQSLHLLHTKDTYNLSGVLRGTSSTLKELQLLATDDDMLPGLANSPILLPNLANLVIRGGTWTNTIEFIRGIRCPSIANLALAAYKKGTRDFGTEMIASLATCLVNAALLPQDTRSYRLLLDDTTILALSTLDETYTARITFAFQASELAAFVKGLPHTIRDGIVEVDWADRYACGGYALWDLGEKLFSRISPYLPHVTNAYFDCRPGLGLLNTWAREDDNAIFPQIERLHIRDIIFDNEQQRDSQIMLSALSRREQQGLPLLVACFHGSRSRLRPSIRDKMVCRRVLLCGKEVPIASDNVSTGAQ